MMQPYSVLMTVWRQDDPGQLAQSLDSLVGQTQPTDDLLVVADGPIPPELTAVLDRYRAAWPMIRLVPLPENVGLGAALNAGLPLCRHELVARMDADDIALPERCALQVARFEQDDQLAIVGTFAEEFADDPSNVVAVKSVPTSHEAIYRYGKRRNPFIHPTVMYKKSVILGLGGYSTLRRGQDIELFTRLLHAGHRAANIAQPLLKFRSDEQLYLRRKTWKASRNYMQTIYKSWRMGYAGFMDLVIAVGMRLTLLLMPPALARLVYRKVLRKSR